MVKLLLILIMISSVCQGGTIRHDVDDQKYIDYGSQHKHVVQIQIIEDNDSINIGSAVAIKDFWVVTASHVATIKGKCSVIVDDRKIDVEKIFIYPNEKLHDVDVAVCKLKEGINFINYPELYENQDELSKVCSVSGYGRTGNGRTGAIRFSNKKRAGSNVIWSTSEKYIYCKMDENGSELEFLISNGDSGGGLFIDGKLAGINSAVLASDKITDSNYGDESQHTRISYCKNWIEEVISGN